MPRDLFGDVQQPSVRVGSRSRYTVPLSLAAHALAVLAVVGDIDPEQTLAWAEKYFGSIPSHDGKRPPRDGGLPDQVAFDAAGVSREVQLRNERSSRDAPARIALLRVTGPFRVDAGSACRRGSLLAGQSSCRLVVRALPEAGSGATGVLELQFAASKGLEPRVRRTSLRMGG